MGSEDGGEDTEEKYTEEEEEVRVRKKKKKKNPAMDSTNEMLMHLAQTVGELYRRKVEKCHRRNKSQGK